MSAIMRVTLLLGCDCDKCNNADQVKFYDGSENNCWGEAFKAGWTVRGMNHYAPGHEPQEAESKTRRVAEELWDYFEKRGQINMPRRR